MLAAEDFDCVILDLGLPDMTGFDLLEKIKLNVKLKGSTYCCLHMARTFPKRKTPSC
ncbi:MAG: hypothetical protein WDN75_06365 [Bacteroidota bacterium]